MTRTFDAPAHIVYQAWAQPELLKRWWVPKSTGMSLLSCEADVRVGGRYRLAFDQGASPPMAFFGRYTEVVPSARLAWTNEESEDGCVTTVTFDEKEGRTLLMLHERYPTKAALDDAIPGMEGCMAESFDQLEELLADLGRDGMQAAASGP